MPQAVPHRPGRVYFDLGGVAKELVPAGLVSLDGLAEGDLRFVCLSLCGEGLAAPVASLNLEVATPCDEHVERLDGCGMIAGMVHAVGVVEAVLSAFLSAPRHQGAEALGGL